MSPAPKMKSLREGRGWDACVGILLSELRAAAAAAAAPLTFARDFAGAGAAL